METNSTQAVKADPSVETKPVKRRKRGDTREDGMVFWQKHPSFPGGEWWMTLEQVAAKRAKEAKRKEALSAKKAALPTKLHRGDTREDGMVFWQYGHDRSNGEIWMTPEKFAAEKDKQTEKKVALSAKRVASLVGLRRGYVREDGMVFWAYASGCADGEYWVSPETFAAGKAKQAKKTSDLVSKRAASPIKLCRGSVREDGMVFWGYGPNYTNGEHWLTPEEFAAKKRRRNIRHRERRATDPLYALKHRLRSLVHVSLKRKGFRKNTETAIMLGCTYEEFRAHIEKQFLPGMTWANFSDCHIDHIVPLDAAKTEEDVYSLNHYTNLRPMWGPDNISKSAKLPKEHELPENLHPKVRGIWERAIREAK